MAEYLASGSSAERFLQCLMSLVLPQAQHSSHPSGRGRSIHEYLEACALVGRESALIIVADEYREVCEAIDLAAFEHLFQLTPELAFALHVPSGSVRELPRGEPRPYETVTAEELPCQLDVVGVDLEAGRAVVVDYKGGRVVPSVWDWAQGDFGALCVFRAFPEVMSIDVQIVHVREHRRAWIQRRTISRWESDLFFEQIRAQHERGLALRARVESFATGVAVVAAARAGADVAEQKALRLAAMSLRRDVDYHTGPWCYFCPSRPWCEAQTQELRALVNRDAFDGVMRMESIPRDLAARIYRDIDGAIATLKIVRSKIFGLASVEPITLEEMPDGSRRMLGHVIEDGNDKLDGATAYDVLREQHCEEVADLAVKLTATKQDVKAALATVAVPRSRTLGTAALERRFLDEMQARGAIERPLRSKVAEYVLPPGERVQLGDGGE